MSVWRYKAVATGGTGGGSVSKGEIAADSAAAARAALRRAGLQALDVRPLGKKNATNNASRGALLAGLRTRLDAHLRKRRGPVKAELLDSLATMLDAGMPLLEALETIGGRRASRILVASLRSSLRDGDPLSTALAAHPAWFDAAEVAMVEAGQRRGELPAVLRNLADRHERSSELMQKIISALTYPAFVAAVGLIVVGILSRKVLPELTAILSGAGVETPALTRAVMWAGRAATAWGWLIALALLVIAISVLTLTPRLTARGIDLSRAIQPLIPRALRRALVARLAGEMCDMVRAGVPAVDALRAIAPTFSGPVAAPLSRAITRAAEAVERGEPLDGALDDSDWFDTEFRALLKAGQASGELDAMLERLAERETRRATRLVDRLAALLEPTVILCLVALVGLIALAALLPLIKMKEIL